MNIYEWCLDKNLFIVYNVRIFVVESEYLFLEDE